jgi:acyl-CoA synthetase (AMP-forming)/AMP-acid ligase II
MLTEYLYRNAATFPDRPFLIWEDSQFSYAAMARGVTRCVAQLTDLGIRQDDRVALICGNRPAFLMAWFALTEIGAITVPLNTSLIGDGLRYTIEQSEVSAVLIEPEFFEAMRDVLAVYRDKMQFLFLDADMEVDQGGAIERRRGAAGSPAAVNAILYTSGTTGLPKGAMISNFSYDTAGHDMVTSLGLTAEDRIMVFLPLFHANPQMYAVSSTLVCGACLILLSRFSASEFFQVARSQRATGFTYVGTVLSILDKSNPVRQLDHGLRWCVGGGAPPAVWKEIEGRFGVEVRELYGMTETGGWVTMNTPGSNRFGSVGPARRGVTVRVVNPDGSDARTGDKGEIVAQSDRSELFFSGYWKKPDITAETLRAGWLHTGDRGWLDADGFLHFAGRLKELIRRGGEMISPVEIELQLLKHPNVRDCAVVGVDDEILGEEIKAAVVLHEQIDAERLASFLASRLPPHMVPRYFAYVDQIPKTETQKIKRHELVKPSGTQFDVKPERSRRPGVAADNR